MRRIIALTLILLLSYSLRSKGQLISTWGIKVGPTLARQQTQFSNLNSSHNSSYRFGINFAVFIEGIRTSNFSMVAQIDYLQRGCVEEFIDTRLIPDALPPETFSSRLDYLSLPVFLKIADRMESSTVFLITGPRIDRLLSSTTEIASYKPMFAAFKKTILGASFGGGLEFNLSERQIFIFELRYDIDLVDSYHSQNYTVRNNAFNLWVGVSL